jgi:UDP-N-acetylmuramate--alanine ligase
MSRGATFFCGIGGSGMSALARLLLARGEPVRGSDRSRDRGDTPAKFAALESAGARLFPQDGSGVDGTVQTVVVSTAVEPEVPDVRAALARGLPVRKRAELLADEFHRYPLRVAVGGTSGKSTVTAMTAHILAAAGLRPTAVNGAEVPGWGGGGAAAANVLAGGADVCVIEADESDGSIALYRPSIAVVTNVSLDHRPLPELRTLFADFAARAEDGAVLNADCPESGALGAGAANTVRFGIAAPDADVRAEEIETRGWGTRFRVAGFPVELQVPGRHNVANALAAIAAAGLAGVDTAAAAAALRSFAGLRRRLEVVGARGGVTVVDDFAHNPDKISASLAALRGAGGRLLVVFQPHGYGPTRLLWAGLVSAFAEGLDPRDLLILTDIYYAGGTAARDLSAADLARDVVSAGRRAEHIPSRADIAARVAREARPGDRVVVMGARDDTLPEFARRLLEEVKR